jgi:chemotaxis protein MotB
MTGISSRIKRRVAAASLPFVAMLLSACVSQQQYDAVVAENQQLKAQLAQSQAEQKFVVADDMLFPSGGYQLSPQGQQALTNLVPRLSGLQNVKIVVYGYTDNAPVGPGLQAMGVADNLDLSTKRAATVASYLIAQGINPNITSAKGFGDTHPVASNDTPQGRAQNRRIEITVQGPGA